MTHAHRARYPSAPYLAKISDNVASAPLPENGLIKTSGVNSSGMPSSPNTGDKIFVRAAESPLASKSSVNTNMLTKNGKTDAAKGIADFAPSVKASYGLTFFIAP